MARLLPDGRVLVASRDDSGHHAEIYDPVKGTFSKSGDMVETTSWHGMVVLANPVDAAQRTAILRARLGFDEDPAALAQQHAKEQAALSAALVAARAALSSLAWSDEVLNHAAARAIEAGVDGMRADLVMLRAARALAALEGRGEVTPADVDAVAELALAHRRPEGSAAQPPGANGQAPQTPQAPERPQEQPPAASVPQGDWGALPAQPEGTAKVQAIAGWPPKKA